MKDYKELTIFVENIKTWIQSYQTIISQTALTTLSIHRAYKGGFINYLSYTASTGDFFTYNPAAATAEPKISAALTSPSLCALDSLTLSELELLSESSASFLFL